MDSKELTIVIVTFKSEAKILDCLKSIGDQANIIVVENSKNDNFKNDLEDKFSNLKCILTHENLGYAKANNIGLKQVTTKYALVLNPDGLPQAFKIGDKFIGKDNVSLILGDNFFFGQSLTKIFKSNINLKSGAKIFIHPVKNPQSYGVATLRGNKVINLTEKPKKIKSNYAVTGLYFFDNKVVEYTKKLKPSKRGELEIIDLLNIYKKKNKLKSEFIGRGASWLDAGNINDFYDATNFIETIENRQGLKIACLEEIALKNKGIKKVDIKKSINFYGNCEYSKYLKSLINA